MTDYSKLVKSFEKASKAANEQKIVTFISSIESKLKYDLDRLYAQNDIEAYNKTVNNVKLQGIKVYRNSEGKHKLDLTNFDFSIAAPFLNKL
jgi:PIN domain nuclease of toxin-antitoxin system